MNLSVRRVLWLIGFSFVLHEAEEWNLVSWMRANFEPAPQFNDVEARTLLVLFSLAGISFTALSIRLFSLRGALYALLPLFVVLILGNALTHIFWLFYFRSYAPGVVTAAFLIVPLTLYLMMTVLRQRLVPPAYVWVLAALALVQPLGAIATGATLTDGQLALQRFGAQLAAWLPGVTS